ncbi:ryncolin-1-like [Dendronephthya gigantea]|uniref:ryncolin-1-like n=1 Tax=Dendronephthya gigantea TaxID=151771 RepID=UPI00106BC87C|nr:ryncolin-1-like [Dendronephthya gigantea]
MGISEWKNVKHTRRLLSLPSNCADLYEKGNSQSGVYEVNPDGKGGFEVFCDMTTSGGGWTVFQRRLDGSVDFYRGWQDYKKGFGDLSGEYWLGLDKIHRMTNILENEFRIDMEDTSGNTRYAHYDFFAVSNENEKYKLNVGGYNGTAGNTLSRHNGMAFTTKDSDNDIWVAGNCALRFKGAWWYWHCHHSNLNGLYHYGAHTSSADGVNWYLWKGHHYSLKSTSMKIRPHNYLPLYRRVHFSIRRAQGYITKINSDYKTFRSHVFIV